jgi:hypothetical protein
MGLFARATDLAGSGNSAGASPVPSAAQPEVLPEASPSAPAGPAESAPPAPAAEITAEELAYRIAGLPRGFPAPVLLFALLRGLLQLKQAALLLLDSRRRVYSPIASTGLDTTSRHRLRLPAGANPPFDRAAAGELVIARGEELEAFRECFSSRQFSAIHELVLVPYVADRGLIGLFLASGLRQPLAEHAVRLLESTMTAAPPLLQPDPEEQEEPGSLRERVTALASLCRSSGHPLLLLRVSLDRLIGLVQEQFPELDGFRLQEHLVWACRRLLAVIGRVETPKPRLLFLLVHGMKDGDAQLLLRQLETALLSDLRGLTDATSIDLRPETRLVDGDAEAALSFLAS